MADRNSDGTFAAGHKSVGGRPKKIRRIEHILERIGLEEVRVGGDTITKLEAVMRAVYGYALKGQSWAVQFIAERTEGKVRDQVDSSVETHHTIRLLDFDDPALKAGEDEGA